MDLKASVVRIPPGRFEPATGEHLHYLELRDGVLESQERHGTVLVQKQPDGRWKPVEPRDGVTLTSQESVLGFWRDAIQDHRVSRHEVVPFDKAYPDRQAWELDLWADHARLTFHDGRSGPPRPQKVSRPKKRSKPVQKKSIVQLKTDPLGFLSHRFVGLLERRIPTYFQPPSPERREKILAALEPGDVILETNLAYPGWKQMLHFGLGSNYTHVAMYEGNGKFLEASPKVGVHRSDLEKYFNDTVKLAVIKMPYASEGDREAALDNFRSIRGKAYNRTPNFLTEEHPKAFGCAEAVTYCLENIPNPIRVPRAVVAGRETVSPAAFKDIQGAVVKYDDEPDYYDDLQQSWPCGGVGIGVGLAADLMATKLLGLAPLTSAAIGVVGGALAYYLTVCVGNYQQKGKFSMFVDGK